MDSAGHRLPTLAAQGCCYLSIRMPVTNMTCGGVAKKGGGKTGRQRVGLDIREGAVADVKRRLNGNRQLLADIPPAVWREVQPPKGTRGWRRLRSG